LLGRYRLRQFRRHGEAGSVDLAAVEDERMRLREVLASFSAKDRFNVDETALFPFAPPDRGLAHEQMSGKSASKFRLTLLFGCNADGSEKREVLFIGKYKKPLCFGKKGPNERGFDYHHNKKAWMNCERFGECAFHIDVPLYDANVAI
jgi:hypothetical protein